MRQRRHWRAQWARRLREQKARQAAVAYAQRTAQRKVPQQQAAAQLSVPARTLRYWRQRQAKDGLRPRPRGRPSLGCNVASRNEVIRFLHHVTGPAVGLPALRALFPTMPRAILEDLLRRYLRVWRRRYRQSGFQLHWHRAGTVWAMDFTRPLHPVDGIYDYVFSLRDLGSHWHLIWMPVTAETAKAIVPILWALFIQEGAPLVLKNDLGSAFIAELTQVTLLEAAVAQLFSPPRCPQYNGALERSNGTLKIYTQQQAASAGHSFRWTSDDLERARRLANTISRPWGPEGPTPEEAWQQRTPISDDERAQFQATLAEQRLIAAQDLGLNLEDALTMSQRAELDRLATSRTLQLLGYLTKTRVDRPPKKPKRLTRAALARRVAKYRRRQDGELNDTAAAPSSLPDAPCVESPLLASRARPPTPAATRAPPRYQLPKIIRVLASLLKCVTMPTVEGHSLPPREDARASQIVTSARQKWTFPSWLRRPITLLISVFKTANKS